MSVLRRPPGSGALQVVTLQKLTWVEPNSHERSREIAQGKTRGARGLTLRAGRGPTDHVRPSAR